MPQVMPREDRIIKTSPVEVNLATLSAKFGGNYSQDVPNGINSIAENWQITWAGLLEAELLAVKNVLDTAKGADYITWTTFTVAKKFKCIKYSINSDEGKYGRYRLQASFEQVFKP